jgi:putative transposase
MPRKGHTEEQILSALHQAEAGSTIPEVCRKLGVSTATFYL